MLVAGKLVFLLQGLVLQTRHDFDDYVSGLAVRSLTQQVNM